MSICSHARKLRGCIHAHLKLCTKAANINNPQSSFFFQSLYIAAKVLFQKTVSQPPLASVILISCARNYQVVRTSHLVLSDKFFIDKLHFFPCISVGTEPIYIASCRHSQEICLVYATFGQWPVTALYLRLFFRR